MPRHYVLRLLLQAIASLAVVAALYIWSELIVLACNDLHWISKDLAIVLVIASLLPAVWSLLRISEVFDPFK